MLHQMYVVGASELVEPDFVFVGAMDDLYLKVIVVPHDGCCC